ncbi:Proteolipid membrane potential modulator [Trichostrongylus colubriformis]|uniref:Proteolipid membrane potential modulator n=1 Tax=Trichostrongylus colubriformis TaxID=6319 RepID=A0AAN8FPD9_TRICO
MCCTILLCILAVFLPPAAVLLDQGCTNQFFINILLTILVWIPGVIHAFWVILCRPGEHRHHHHHHHHHDCH